MQFVNKNVFIFKMLEISIISIFLCLLLLQTFFSMIGLIKEFLSQLEFFFLSLILFFLIFLLSNY